MNNDKTIIVIGNGPSIRKIDWNKLSGFNTFGINGSFKLWNDINWYPTYQYIGRMHRKQWTEGLKKFIQSNTCKNVFIKPYEYPDIELRENCIPMTFYEYPNKSPNPDKWSDPFDVDVKTAYEFYKHRYGQENADKAIASLPEDIDNELNCYGVFKTMEGKKNLIGKDYIVKPRFVREFNLPNSFDRFTYEGGMSGEVSCIIAWMLGYEKILLVGCDNNFIVNEDETMDQKSSYGIDDMFYGNEYNLNEDIQCPICRTTTGLRDSMVETWAHLKYMIEFHNADLKVLNCTPVDNIKAFETSTLEKELGTNV